MKLLDFFRFKILLFNKSKRSQKIIFKSDFSNNQTFYEKIVVSSLFA